MERTLSLMASSSHDSATTESALYVDFMTNDMKPREVVVHALPAPKGRLLFEPPVIALAEFCKCLRTHPLQPAPPRA